LKNWRAEPHRNVSNNVPKDYWKELENGSRRSKVSQARAQIARRGMEEIGLSAAEIARRLGVATSSITRAIEKLAS